MNMNLVIKFGKKALEYAGPISEGIMRAMDVMDKQKTKQTVAELVARVAELESKIK